MDWITLLVTLVPALVHASTKVIEEVVAKPLMEPAQEQFRKRVLRGYKAKAGDTKLHRAIATALEGFAEIVDTDLHFTLKRALHQLTESGERREAQREAVAAAALAMTAEDPVQIPVTLLTALDLDVAYRPILARLLWAFRTALAESDADFRELAAFVRDDAGYARLREMAAGIESLAATVTEKTADGLPAERVVVVEPKPAVHNLTALWNEYMAYLVNTYRRLNFRGIVQTKTLVELPLAEIYVSLSAAPIGQRQTDEACDVLDEAALRDGDGSARALRERAERLKLVDILQKEPRLVVIGDPGSGKTTFLRYVALALAEGQEAAQERLGLTASWLPVYLPLAAYNQALRQERVSLEDYVQRYWDTRSFDRPAMVQLIARALKAGRVLLLLDGLDEVGSRAERLSIARQVEAWANSYGPRGNRVLVTSRIVGYDEAPLACDFRVYTLNPFGLEEMACFARQWCVAYRRWADPEMPENLVIEKGEAEANSLIEEIRSDARVESLASNPLLITIIALIHYKGTRLPDHRVELYNLCIQTLVETWREARSEAGPVGESLRVANEIKVLAPFALWLQEEAPGPGGAARRDAVQAKLLALLERQFRGDREAAEREVDLFLELGKRQTGVLVERGEGWFGFFHPTFKEYLAARACVLAGQLKGVAGTWAKLQRHVGDALWHEVILLTVGYKAIIESQGEAAAYLIRRIADAPPDGSGAQPGDNVVLAGRCLVDIGQTLVPDDCWDDITDQLRCVMQNLAPGTDPHILPLESLDYAASTRYAAAETLDRLGWLPKDLDSWVWIGESGTEGVTGKGFWMAKYPVTNYQFAQFMDAGGYENPAYWGGTESAAWHWRIEEYNKDWRGEDPVTQPEYWDDPRFGKTRRGYPVVGISWYEAQAYYAWFGEQLKVEGYRLQVWKDGQPSTFNFQPSTYAARLPTDEEWIAAAGGAENDRYPWGVVWDASRANTVESSLGGTSPVGMYPSGPSPFSVWDMAGNVWEWLSSESGSGYALRGGAWDGDLNVARVTARYWNDADNSYDFIGMRLVLSPNSPDF